MATDPKQILSGDDEGDLVASLAGTRAQRMLRLQVGMFGLGAMILLVGLASIVIEQTKEVEASAVPQAAPTTEPAAEQASPRNPLAEAGVVPDFPLEQPTPAPTTGRGGQGQQQTDANPAQP